MLPGTHACSSQVIYQRGSVATSLVFLLKGQIDVYSGPDSSLIKRLSPAAECVVMREDSFQDSLQNCSFGEMESTVEATVATEGVLGHSCSATLRRTCLP